MGGCTSTSQFLVLTRSSKSYLDSNWKNTLSVLSKSWTVFWCPQSIAVRDFFNGWWSCVVTRNTRMSRKCVVGSVVGLRGCVVGFLRCHSLTRKSRERRQGCVELGEVWGDFPFLSRVVALNRMIRNRFVARSSWCIDSGGEVSDVPRKCMDGSISSSKFIVLTRSSKSYLVSNWKNMLSILNRCSGLNNTCEFRVLPIAAPPPITRGCSI